MKTLYLSLMAILVFPLFHANLAYSQNITPSPLEQFKSGTPVNDVKCNDDMQLVIKVDDGSPACVKPNTANILIERGWAKETSSQISYNSTLSASAMPCDTPYPTNSYGYPINAYYSVMYMPMNSVGKLCVQYYTYNDLTFVPITIFEINATDYNQNATGFVISASPNVIPKEKLTTVVYTIRTGNYSGFYGLSIFCNGMPFAVGYNKDSLTLSNFTRLVWFPMCPSQSFDYHIVGLSGIGLKYNQ